MKTLSKPVGYEDDLGEYKTIYESMDIPYAWGFEITRHLGELKFNMLRAHGELVHLGDYFSGQWAVIVKQLDQEECVRAAIKKYGEVSHVKVGPRGGFQKVTYGTKKDKYGMSKGDTWNSDFDPTHYCLEGTDVHIDKKTDPRVEYEPPTQAMLDAIKKRKAAAKRNAAKKAAAKRRKEITKAKKLAAKG